MKLATVSKGGQQLFGALTERGFIDLGARFKGRLRNPEYLDSQSRIT
ncbi:MAG: hypothetical protein WCO72_07170 [Betaproteobacteria bacterium]